VGVPMLVMKAVEEARRALEVLQLVSMEDLDDLSEILTQIVDGLRVYVAALAGCGRMAESCVNRVVEAR